MVQKEEWHRYNGDTSVLQVHLDIVLIAPVVVLRDDGSLRIMQAVLL